VFVWRSGGGRGLGVLNLFFCGDRELWGEEVGYVEDTASVFVVQKVCVKCVGEKQGGKKKGSGRGGKGVGWVVFGFVVGCFGAGRRKSACGVEVNRGKKRQAKTRGGERAAARIKGWWGPRVGGEFV